MLTSKLMYYMRNNQNFIQYNKSCTVKSKMRDCLTLKRPCFFGSPTLGGGGGGSIIPFLHFV